MGGLVFGGGEELIRNNREMMVGKELLWCFGKVAQLEQFFDLFNYAKKKYQPVPMGKNKQTV